MLLIQHAQVDHRITQLVLARDGREMRAHPEDKDRQRLFTTLAAHARAPDED